MPTGLRRLSPPPCMRAVLNSIYCNLDRDLNDRMPINREDPDAHHIPLPQAWRENGCLELLGLSILVSLSHSEQIAPRRQACAMSQFRGMGIHSACLSDDEGAASHKVMSALCEHAEEPAVMSCTL